MTSGKAPMPKLPATASLEQPPACMTSMTPTLRNLFRKLANWPGLKLAILLAACACMPVYGADWTLDVLMHMLAQRGSGHATFTETKNLAMLDIPIKSSGELRFEAPDFLEMRTLEPRPQILTLRASQLSIESNGNTRRIDLVNYPYAAVLVGSIRSTLNGDSLALQHDFKVKLGGNPAHWKLTLVPIDAGARARVKEIRISGHQAQVSQIEMDQADGDQSLMLVRPLPKP
jgi:hypothetical protein